MGRPEPPDAMLPPWDDATPQARPEPSRADGVAAPTGTFGLRILTVSEATRTIRGVVTADPRLRDVWVEGEVGRVTISSAGHAYFALKDDRNQLQCVWFRDDRLGSPFEARTGLHVVVNGRIDLYEPNGALQLYVAGLQPAGFGDLAVRLEEVKARLAAEGLFATDRKRALPARPAVVAVVTSPSGAAWHDVRTVLRRRWPLAELLLVPCQVQGDGAAPSVAAALDRLARLVERGLAAGAEVPQVTILARGGGSLEDLWSFNEETVVRSIVGHPIPVVTGVGHEVDVTLADLAADVRAPTPSAAAELVVPDRLEILAAVRTAGRRLDGEAVRRVAVARTGLAGERRALERLDPRGALAADRERVGRLLDRASRAVTDRVTAHRTVTERLAVRFAPLLGGRLERGRAAFATASAGLAALGPQATLDRGYAIVRRDDGAVVRSPDEVPPGARLAVTVARGAFRVRRESEERR